MTFQNTAYFLWINSLYAFTVVKLCLKHSEYLDYIWDTQTKQKALNPAGLSCLSSMIISRGKCPYRTPDWTAGVWYLVGAESFPLLKAFRSALSLAQPPTQWVQGALSLGSTAAETWSWPFAFIYYRGKKQWSCTPAARYVFMARCLSDCVRERFQLHLNFPRRFLQNIRAVSWNNSHSSWL
jgi:hypothetical protein